MPFKIVQSIENGEFCVSSVPAGWEEKNTLKSKLSRNEWSVPTDKWEQIPCIVKGVYNTSAEADANLELLESEKYMEFDVICDTTEPLKNYSAQSQQAVNTITSNASQSVNCVINFVLLKIAFIKCTVPISE